MLQQRQDIFKTTTCPDCNGTGEIQLDTDHKNGKIAKLATLHFQNRSKHPLYFKGVSVVEYNADEIRNQKTKEEKNEKTKRQNMYRSDI
jgi:hypothetical protein